MQHHMTIQSFSSRTGLPASTLRYYEKESLLLPDFRAENGYRLYSENQIPKAIQIHSLRQVGISLAEIREYLTSDEHKQEEWLRKWRKDIDAKLSVLHVAKQFLYGMEPANEHIRLVKWDEPGRILWFRHRVKRQLHPFARAMDERVQFMRRHGLMHSQEVFVKQEQIDGDEMVGKVGFRLRGKPSLPERLMRDEVEIEGYEPTLFVSLDCSPHDPYSCFSLMLTIQSFGFEPTGPNLERYPLPESNHYELMIPVIHEPRAEA